MKDTTKMTSDTVRHRWTFHRVGGVDQVVLKDAADLTNLPELDLKLWMALSMPVTGSELDHKTLELIDTDNNGRIHPEEVLEALSWTCDALNDPGLLLKSQEAVKLTDIKDPELAAGAKRVLSNLGRGNADSIALSDVSDRAKIFSQTLFNGDGVVPPESAGEDEETRTLLNEIVECYGGEMDRSGKPGVNNELLTRFFEEAEAFKNWLASSRDPGIASLGENTAAAVKSLEPLEAKVDDYFARCRLAAFDERALPSLNRDAAEYEELAAGTLDLAVPAAAAFPIGRIEPNKPLPLRDDINPAWIDAVSAFVSSAVEPVLGSDVSELSEDGWLKIKDSLAKFRQHASEKPDTPVASLGEERLSQLLESDLKSRAENLIAQDLDVAPENEKITIVEKLVRFCRDLPVLLTNYVNFSAFYGRTGAVFQNGVLYLDGRACTLCVDVLDEARHASLADLSGFFLAYCTLQRPEGVERKIVAAITDGDSDNLMVGRNGLFIDREGLNWDATITRIVSSPISVREAFWLPYKKFVRMIEEQIAKRAQAADDSATEKMAANIEGVLSADPAAKPESKPAIAAKPIELGTIALIGTAIGGISALVGGFLKALFSLGFWVPLGVVGILLLISGPSMLLASLKLRRRNLAPLLDANGWAINTRARVNIPFGGALTNLAQLPPGTIPSYQDPFSDKRRSWIGWLILIVIAITAAAWFAGALDRRLPERFKRNKTEAVAVVEEVVEEVAGESPESGEVIPAETEVPEVE